MAPVSLVLAFEANPASEAHRSARPAARRRRYDERAANDGC
ncbi:MAG: hypothetical protein WCA82_05330 [Jiangellales bacterium]